MPYAPAPKTYFGPPKGSKIDWLQPLAESWSEWGRMILVIVLIGVIIYLLFMASKEEADSKWWSQWK